jgi:hypothetical protein
MARRKGRPGDYLMTDDYFGFTRFASQLKKDFWGAYAERPLKRNLQEIAVPLDDPAPVPNYRGPNYEVSPTCLGELAPLYVGNTNVRTNTNNMAFQVLEFINDIANDEL